MEPCSRVVADLIDEDPVTCAEQLRCQLDARLVIDDIVALVIDMNLAHDYAGTAHDALPRIRDTKARMLPPNVALATSDSSR